MRKRCLSALLAVLLCVSMLAGCNKEPTSGGSGSSQSGGTQSAVSTSAPGDFPITNEKVTLKVFYTPYEWITDMEDNQVTKWLEEKTNVHVEWMLVSTEAAEKINLLLATNAKKDMPDVFLAGISRAQVESYGAQGVLMPLNDLIDKYSVNYKDDLFMHNDQLEQQMTAFDGNIYFLPRYYETTHVRHTSRFWMNSKWLERVGKKTPTTTDEFYDVLKAFKEQDANGNGDPNDEIPYVAYTGAAGSISNFVMNAFVYSPTGDPKLYLEDGKILASYAQEGWREGLRFHKTLYSEGLLDPECFTLTTEQVMALSGDENGSRIGSIADAYVGFIDLTSPEASDYEALAPLTGPSGLKVAPVDKYNPAPFFCISSYCEIPEIAFRWADCQAVDIAGNLKDGNYEWMNLWYGTEDSKGAWRRAKDGEVSFTGEQALYKTLFTWGDKLNNHWYENFLINMKAEWKPLGAYDENGNYNLEKTLYDATVNLYEPCEEDKTLPDLSLTEDEIKETSEIRTNLKSYYEECMAKFVRDEMSLDNDWDAYLKELENIGLSRMIEIYQKAYDRAYK